MALDRSVLARGAKRVPFDSIPVIDIGAMFGEDRAAMELVAAEIDKACREIGFYRLIGHGVDQELIAATFAAARRFFARPEAEKQRQHIRHSFPNQRGYVPLFEENLDGGLTRDFKESFDLGVDLAPDHPDVAAGKPFSAPNVWPDRDRDFRETVSAYHRAMLGLGQRLVQLTAIGLRLPEEAFDEFMRRPIGNLRLLHYPPVPPGAGDDVGGAGAHTDYGFLTVLAQDGVGGLEVEAPSGN